MYGWINNILEKYILSFENGDDLWGAIKVAAKCEVPNDNWVFSEAYPDEWTFSLISAAAKALETPHDNFLEKLGGFLVVYSSLKGFDTLMRCQGHSLVQFLKNIDEMHSHLQFAVAGGDKSAFPTFFCEGDPSDPENRMTLFYKSRHGSSLAQFVVGAVKEVARLYFKLTLEMTMLATQNSREGVEFSSWLVEVTGKIEDGDIETTQQGAPAASLSESKSTAASTATASRKAPHPLPKNGQIMSGEELVCPFTGQKMARPTSISTQAGDRSEVSPTSLRIKPSAQSGATPLPHEKSELSRFERQTILEGGLTGAHLKEIFPFHIVVDRNFTVTHVGSKLSQFVPGVSVGSRIDRCFSFEQPLACNWNWDDLIFRRESLFILTDILNHDPDDVVDGKPKRRPRLSGGLYLFGDAFSRDGSRHDINNEKLLFSAMFLVQPDVESFAEMIDLNVTLSDFPKHSSQPRLIRQCEYLQSETYLGEKSRAETANAKHLLDMKRTFVRYVSHELRTPLNTVSMGLKLIQGMNGSLDKLTDIKTMLQDSEELLSEIFVMNGEIRDSCDVAVEILNDLLMYEKMEGNGLILEKEKHAAVPLTYNTIKTLTVLAKQSSVKLTCSFDGSTFSRGELANPSVFMEVDKSKFAQLMRKIVTNAFKMLPTANRRSSMVKSSGNKSVGSIEDMRCVNVHISTVWKLLHFDDDDDDGGDDDEGEGKEGQGQLLPDGSAMLSRAESTMTDIRSNAAKGSDRNGGYRSHNESSVVAESVCGEPTKKRRKRIKRKMRFVRITVKDSGAGLTEEEQKTLMSQMLHFDPARLQAGDHGVGLGLFIAKGIMDIHGGTLGVYSEGVGKGSSYYVDFPAIVEEQKDVAKKEKPTTKNSAQPSESLLKAPSLAKIDAVTVKHLDDRKRDFTEEDEKTDENDYEKLRNFIANSLKPFMPPPTRENAHSSSRSGRMGDRRVSNVALAEWKSQRRNPQSSGAGLSANPNGLSSLAPAAFPIPAYSDCSAPSDGGPDEKQDNDDNNCGAMDLQRDNEGDNTAPPPLDVSVHNGCADHPLEDEDLSPVPAIRNPVSISLTSVAERHQPHSHSRRRSSHARSEQESYMEKVAMEEEMQFGQIRCPSPPLFSFADDQYDHKHDPKGSKFKPRFRPDPPHSATNRSDSDSMSVRSMNSIDASLASVHTTASKAPKVTGKTLAATNFLNILVVDDSVATRKMIVRFLKMKKLCENPIEAADGAEALRIVELSYGDVSDVTAAPKYPMFDVVLMDFVMPVMDGPTATQRIRDLGFKGMVIGITGNVLAEDKAFFKARGANDVITKPADMTLLESMLRKIPPKALPTPVSNSAKSFDPDDAATASMSVSLSQGRTVDFDKKAQSKTSKSPQDVTKSSQVAPESLQTFIQTTRAQSDSTNNRKRLSIPTVASRLQRLFTGSIDIDKALYGRANTSPALPGRISPGEIDDENALDSPQSLFIMRASENLGGGAANFVPRGQWSRFKSFLGLSRVSPSGHK